jgi:hypothetical protein
MLFACRDCFCTLRPRRLFHRVDPDTPTFSVVATLTNAHSEVSTVIGDGAQGRDI